MSAIKSVNDIQRVLATGGAHLGDILFWALNSVDISHADLHSIWVGCGLDPNLLPEDQTDGKAFRQAVRDTQVGLTGKLIRQVEDDAKRLSFAVVTEDKDVGAKEVRHRQIALVELDLVTGQIDVSGENVLDDTAQKLVKAAYDGRGRHNGRDIMLTLVKTMKALDAITLRDRGGVYWVPAPQAHNVAALQTAVRLISGGSALNVVPVFDTADGRAALSSATTLTLEEEFKKLSEEVELFLQEAPRPSTLSRRIAEFEELRSRARMYSMVLGFSAQQLEEGISKMTATVEALLAGITEEKQAA